MLAIEFSIIDLGSTEPSQLVQMVRIPRFHRGEPGSIPGLGIREHGYRDLAQWKRVALITQRSQDRNLESRTGARKMPT